MACIFMPKGDSKLQAICFYKIIILIYTCISPSLSIISCPKQYLYQIGTKTTCQIEDGWKTPCDNPNVKFAIIECINGHFNHIGNQNIECDLKTGNWLEIPLPCFPIFSGCLGSNDKNEIEKSYPNIPLFTNLTAYPTWYVEILKTPPITGEKNLFPGVIMGARLVMTWAKFFNKGSFNPKDYIVRLYKNGSHQDYKVGWIEFKESEDLYTTDDDKNFDRICYLILAQENFFNLERHVTETACLDYDKIPLFVANKWFIELMRARLEMNLIPEYPRQCIVPHVEKKRVARLCFKTLKGNPLLECPETVPTLQQTCEIGYKNKNNNDLLAMCVEGRWEINYNSSNDCELICGEAEETPTDEQQLFVFGGQKTKLKTAPWHVGLYTNITRNKTPYDLVCAGTIVHKNIVISAAHCFYNLNTNTRIEASNFFVGAGILNRDDYLTTKKKSTAQFVRVKDIKFPREYSSFRNDICIVIVQSNFVFNSYVKPVCIDWLSPSDEETLPDGAEGHIFGWGSTSSRNTPSEHLLTAKLKVVNHEECRKLGRMIDISDENFCGSNENGSSACGGDSGGGFVVEKQIDNKKRYFLWGVISSGSAQDNYCSNNSITIFTNIQYFPEIKTIITKESFNLNRQKLSELARHQIYTHKIWEPGQWIRDELQFRLSLESNPKTDFT